MQGGVLYGDGGDGQARAQGLAPDLGYVVLPESIEVNGERYSVRTLSNGFTTGDEVLEYIVIPRSVVDIGGLRYAYNLGCLYYGGTAEEFEAVTGPVPYGTDVYFYSESEPTASGRYWHWNEAGNVPEPWPTSFSENFAARVQEIAGEDSFTFQLSLGKNGYSDVYTFRRDGQLLAMETSAADGYGYYQDGYVYAMSETAPGEYGRTISRAAEAELLRARPDGSHDVGYAERRKSVFGGGGTGIRERRANLFDRLSRAGGHFHRFGRKHFSPRGRTRPFLQGIQRL